MFSPNLVRCAIVLAVFFVLAAVFFLNLAERSDAAGIVYTGLSPGLAVACSGAASDWVAVRANLYDAVAGWAIPGFFNVGCKADSFDGSFYYEGPDAAHTIARFGPKCGGGAGIGSGGAVCMGSCTLPFNIQADALNYSPTPVWFINHEVGISNTLYGPPGGPTGNANTANYNIYLDRAACETCGWACSGLTPVCYDPWGNACTSLPACAGDSTYCSGGQLCHTNRTCAGAGSCVDNADSCAPDPSCGTNILGRVFVDNNVNGSYDAGEQFVQNGVSCGTPLSFTLAGTRVDYGGPVAGSVPPNLCNADPFYQTGLITPGIYTVSVKPPLGWAAITKTQTVDSTAGDKHVWFGISREPVAEASIAKTASGPWSNSIIITNADPQVDKSKNFEFYLSSQIDRNGDGNASYDPKGGPITCTWDYDTGNTDPATEFTGCVLGEGQFTEAKRQEMVTYWRNKIEGSYKDVIKLTVRDQYGLTDEDFVGIIKEEVIPPKIRLLNADSFCDGGTPVNVLKWEVEFATSYEIKYCEGFGCVPNIPITSGAFTANPIEISHRVAKDKTTYVYSFIAHGPGGDVEKATAWESRNCKGTIVLATYVVDQSGKRLVLLPEVTVKLTNPAGTVIATTVSNNTGFARFEKLIPGTYGVLGYKARYAGHAKQAGDCLTNTYTTANATIGPNTTTEGLLAAWDNNVPVAADKTTFCHDLGLFGKAFSVTCEAAPNPQQVTKPVTWTAKVSGREPPYTYSWSGSAGLSGATEQVTKIYNSIGFFSAFVTVSAEGESKTGFCEVRITGPPVCDPNDFPDNKFNRCLFDYNFDTSPLSSTVSDGKILNISAEPLLQDPIADQNKQIGSAIAFSYNWQRSVIDFSSQTDKVGGEWRGTINFRPDEYKFVVDADDGIELTVDLNGNGSLADETPIISQWHNYDDAVKGHYESAYQLLSGKRKVLLRWFENTDEAKIKFLWYNRTCHMSDLSNRLHVCFYKGTALSAGEFIGERDDAVFGRTPVSAFANPIQKDYGVGGEFGEIDNFSGFWQGFLTFDPGLYKFSVDTNDGVRLDVGGEGIYEIDEWRDHTGTHETPFMAVGGSTLIKLEWYEKDGLAKINFRWSKKVAFLEETRGTLGKLFASLLSLFVI